MKSNISKLFLAIVIFGWGIDVAYSKSKIPPPGPTQQYKGRTLIGSSYPNVRNKLFFETVKIAIDLTEKLPKNLRKYPRAIKRIYYDPPSKHRKAKGIKTNIVGVYTYGSNIKKIAPVIIYQDMKYSSGLRVALSLLGNGLRAFEHKNAIKLIRKIQYMRANKNKFSSQQIEKTKNSLRKFFLRISRKDMKLVKKFECKSMRVKFEAYKAFNLGARRTDALARKISRRNCWK